MFDADVPDECSVCGDDLGDEYTVHAYHVKNPIKSGYLSGFDFRGYLHRLHPNHTHEVHVPICEYCDAPDVPPAPDPRPHGAIAGSATVVTAVMAWALIGAVVGATTVGGVPFYAATTVTFGLYAVGKQLQTKRLKEREKTEMWRDWDVTPVLAEQDEDPGEEARERFLAGEIDEDELEARLDEEIADDEGRETERVMER